MRQLDFNTLDKLVASDQWKALADQATESIKALLKDKYTVYDHPPVYGKDYNEDLIVRQQRFHEKKRSAPQEER